MERLLNVQDAAAELGTPVRFVRRLVAERRIRFHKIGKYVRISSTDLHAFITAGAIEPTAATLSARRIAQVAPVGSRAKGWAGASGG